MSNTELCSHIISWNQWFTTVASNEIRLPQLLKPKLLFIGLNRVVFSSKDSEMSPYIKVFFLFYFIVSGSSIQSKITDACLYGNKKSFHENPQRRRSRRRRRRSRHTKTQRNVEITKMYTTDTQVKPFSHQIWFNVYLQTGETISPGNLRQHLRFLSTDGPLIPITTSAKVLLVGPHDLLERADIGSGENWGRKGDKELITRQTTWVRFYKKSEIIHIEIIIWKTVQSKCEQMFGNYPCCFWNQTVKYE